MTNEQIVLLQNINKVLDTIFGDMNGLVSRTITIFYTHSATFISSEVKTPPIFFVLNFDVLGDSVGHRM